MDFYRGDRLEVINTLSVLVPQNDEPVLQKEAVTPVLPDTNRTKIITPQELQKQNTPDKTLDKTWLYILIGIVIIVVFIILITILSSKLSSLAAAIEYASERSSNHNISLKLPKNDKKQSLLIDSQRDPLHVNVLEKDEKETDERLDFSFLEKLKPQEFLVLLDSENLTSIEISYILIKLSPTFVKKILTDIKRSPQIIQALLEESEIPKERCKELHKRLFSVYSNILQSQTIKVDGKQALAKIINYLPFEQATTTLNHINKISKVAGKKVRDQVLLLEDIIKLDAPLIKELILDLDSTLLTKFLTSVDSDIKNKFMENMSERNILIFSEEMRQYDDMTETEKQTAINMTLQEIKSIFLDLLKQTQKHRRVSFCKR